MLNCVILDLNSIISKLTLILLQKRSNKHERWIISILVLRVNKMVLQMANALFLQMSEQKRQEVEERITLNCVRM